MPRSGGTVYIGSSTSGAPALEEGTAPTNNLASIMKNNVLLVESSLQPAGHIYLSAEWPSIWYATYPAGAGRTWPEQHELSSTEEVENLLGVHMNRFDQVFRRLS